MNYNFDIYFVTFIQCRWAQNAQLNVRYNTTVVDIQSSRRQFSDEQDQSRLSQNVPRFTIEMRVNGSAQNHNKRRLCLSARVLVLATGLEPQHQSGDPLDFDPFPVANLDELAETYSHFDTDLSQFEVGLYLSFCISTIPDQ